MLGKLDVGITVYLGGFTFCFLSAAEIAGTSPSFWESRTEPQTLFIRPQIRQQMATLDSLRSGWLELEMSPIPFQVSTMLG